MARFDIRSDLKQNLALSATIATDTTTAGAIIDTADYELGLMFAVMANNYTDGTYNFTLEHGLDPALSDAVPIPTDNIIGLLSDLALTAEDAAGDKLNTVGVFGNKRYVRINAVSTITTLGSDIVAVVTQAAECVSVD